VNAAVEDVAEFHGRPASMAAITPPPVIVRVHAAPERIASGERMTFTLWAGPVPIHWTACFEDVSPAGFTDRQLNGPFGSWVHRHGFERVDDSVTDVVDRIEASFKQHLFWGIVGRLMWAGMPLLFRFRAQRTRAVLEAPTRGRL
jgi:ligand-binding SRPBCC domain-containing protein